MPYGPAAARRVAAPTTSPVRGRDLPTKPLWPVNQSSPSPSKVAVLRLAFGAAAGSGKAPHGAVRPADAHDRVLAAVGDPRRAVRALDDAVRRGAAAERHQLDARALRVEPAEVAAALRREPDAAVGRRRDVVDAGRLARPERPAAHRSRRAARAARQRRERSASGERCQRVASRWNPHGVPSVHELVGAGAPPHVQASGKCGWSARRTRASRCDTAGSFPGASEAPSIATGDLTMTDTPLSLRRRQLLAGSAGAIAGAGLVGLTGEAAAQAAASAAAPAGAKPLPAYVAWKDANAVIVHNPNELETKRSAFGTSGITSSDRLYVRNNVTPPDPSILADRGCLAGRGRRRAQPAHVDRRRAEDDRRRDRRRRCCSAPATAARSSRTSRAARKWTVGASGCVLWSGVPVRYVVESLGGVAPGHALPHGHRRRDLPRRHRSAERDRRALVADRGDERRTARVGDERRAAAARPRRARCAWSFPATRGVNNVKYVKRVAFTPVEIAGNDQKTRYRLTPIGDQGRLRPIRPCSP